MPTPIESLDTIDDHPIVQAAWAETRPQDEIVAARAEAEQLEAEWDDLLALEPTTPTEESIAALRRVSLILQDV